MISIIIPVYNAEKYLQECIESILCQKYDDFEVILVNDGSCDNSSIICDNYAVNDIRIHVFHKENGGVSSARNFGIERANGDWIVFADADDCFTPTAFEHFAEAIKKNYDLFLFNVVKRKNDMSKILFDIKEGELPSVRKVYNRAVWAHLFSAHVIKENNIKFSEKLSYSEDTLFLYQVMLHCNKSYQINEVCYEYRVNEFSACASTDGFKIAVHQFLAAKEFKLLKQSQYCSVSFSIVLDYEIGRLLKMAFYSFAYHNGYNKLKLLRNYYCKLFGGSVYSLFRFYYLYLSQFLLSLRKKYIKIHRI